MKKTFLRLLRINIIIKYLVEKCKVDPNLKDKYGYTPLNYASSKDYLDIVKYLVEECKIESGNV